MPELPEVEIAARNLRRWTAGRSIRALRPGKNAAAIFRPAAPRTLAALTGARFGDLRRVGKNLLFTLETPAGKAGKKAGPAAHAVKEGLWSHLGMTGKWLRRRAGEPPPRSSRLELELDDGSRLHYVDPRMFGRFRRVPGADFARVPELAALGPDPLTDGIDARALHERLARTRTPIKVAMLDQGLLPGVGNIQASEALHRAKIDPRRPSRSLSAAEVARLARGVLASIEFTLSTFTKAGVDQDGAEISYVEERKTPNPFLVYGKAGQPCPRGDGTITRIVQAQRATFFCAACQR